MKWSTGRDQVVGSVILVASVVGVLVYAWLVFLTAWWGLVLRLTGFIAVGGILAIMAWIGWTLATTPPPKPLETLETAETEAEKASETSETSETETAETKAS